MNDDEKLNHILIKLNDLSEKLESIEKDTKAMRNHIDFITQMYEKYKNGLDFVHTMFSRCK